DALPGLANWPLPAPTTGQRGWFALLQPNATSVSASLAIDRTRAWFDTSQGVYIDVYTLADPLYGNVQARWSLAPGSAPNAAATVLGQGVTHAAVGGPPVARSTFGPVTWSPSPDACLQVELVGADPGKPARLVSVGFRAVANPVGIAVTDIAGGGHNASSLLSEHVAAMDHLTSLGVDCVFISLGANDAWTSPDVYKQRLTALIAAVRQRTHPELPVIILGDPYRRGLTTVALDWLDHFPRAAADLAQELPSVCAVNSRRLTHDAGWTPDSGSAYLVDGVHYNPTGATLKAAAEVGALWGSFVCPADVGVQGGLPGRDGGLDNNDFVAFIDAFFARHPIADFGRQGGLPLSDGRFDNNDFVVFIDSYFAGCP
ncbi:MAG TPA: SGNH/GDSL hydrolase family protein, partial [Phycisphaerales bacterium]|nr:SGNH/GDSL hydrolase family protein [Phycisphaerales bacterium]